MAKQEAATTRTISAREFFKPALTGGVIASISVLVTVFVINLNSDWNEESLRYKEALFYALAGKEPILAYPETLRALRAAECLKDVCAKIMPITKLLEYERALSFVFDKLTSYQWKEFSVLFNNTSLLTPVITEMAGDWRWHWVRNSSEDMAIVNSLLRGEKPDIPKFNYSYPTLSKKTWLWAISFIQFCAFLMYYICRAVRRSSNYDRPPPWHKVPWEKPGTFITLLCLMPGAIPLILVAGFFNFCSIDIRKVWTERRTSKAAGKPQFAPYKFGESSAEGEELLTRLKTRLGR